MKTFLALMLLLISCHCGEIKHSNTGSGYVRNVWQVYGDCYYVTFERDDGMVFVYRFSNYPAVWTGMRASIDYDYDSTRGCSYTAGWVKRLE